MQRLFQNSMTIVRHYDKLTLFITFTINFHWLEIKKKLTKFSRQITSNRSNIVSRVFRMKIVRLLDNVIKRKMFSKCLDRVWIVKYQKRDLSHVHLLMFLKDQFLIANCVDDIVCAKLSNLVLHSNDVLREIVERQLTHDSCEIVMSIVSCMSTKHELNVCFKRYSREFQDATTIEKDSYSTYRRRQDDRTWKIKLLDNREFTFDNRWMISYNSYLTRRYQTHINVEVCAIVKIVKYIHKYVYKDCNQITLQIQKNDEITRHLNERYIDSSQIVWELFEYLTHEKHSLVHHLLVHLLDQQIVYFDSNLFVEELQNRLNMSTFELLTYFVYNRVNSNDREHLYQNFSINHVWKSREKRWQIRQREEAIDRIYHCSSLTSEKYFLRLLLISVTDSTSYEYLRTIDDVLHFIFQTICNALDLLKDD
jgi:hypothetical protein